VFVTSMVSTATFSRATHVGVRALRRYHELGLLELVEVDAGTGYRRYATQQIVTAQTIRRLRDLDTRLHDIHAAASSVREVDVPIRARRR
jgi:DNA-binding transcriptional MerR regulator